MITFFLFRSVIAESPLFIRPHSKTVLSRAINDDTEFLAKHMVMDYSLLLGIEQNSCRLVVGIIGIVSRTIGIVSRTIGIVSRIIGIVFRTIAIVFRTIAIVFKTIAIVFRIIAIVFRNFYRSLVIKRTVANLLFLLKTLFVRSRGTRSWRCM
jgi:hypothetical protein